MSFQLPKKKNATQSQEFTSSTSLTTTTQRKNEKILRLRKHIYVDSNTQIEYIIRLMLFPPSNSFAQFLKHNNPEYHNNSFPFDTDFDASQNKLLQHLDSYGISRSDISSSWLPIQQTGPGEGNLNRALYWTNTYDILNPNLEYNKNRSNELQKIVDWFMR